MKIKARFLKYNEEDGKMKRKKKMKGFRPSKGFLKRWNVKNLFWILIEATL